MPKGLMDPRSSRSSHIFVDRRTLYVFVFFHISFSNLMIGQDFALGGKQTLRRTLTLGLTKGSRIKLMQEVN